MVAVHNVPAVSHGPWRTSKALTAAVCIMPLLLLATVSTMGPGQWAEVLHRQPALQEGSGGGACEGRGQQSRRRQPQPVVMLIDSRSGSTWMTNALNLNDNIIFMMEKFNANSSWLPNGSGSTSAPAPAEAFLTTRYEDLYTFWRDKQTANGSQVDVFSQSAPKKRFEEVRVVGMKVRPAKAGLWPGTPQWDVLERVQPKLICSYRRNIVKGAISEARAMALHAACGTYNLLPSTNCSVPANWTLNAADLPHWIKGKAEKQAFLLDICKQASQRFNVLYVAYEDLLADAAGSMDRIMEHIGFGPEERLPFVQGIQSLPVDVHKNTPDSLSNAFSPQHLESLKAAAQAAYADMALEMFN